MASFHSMRKGKLETHPLKEIHQVFVMNLLRVEDKAVVYEKSEILGAGETVRI